MVGEERGYGRRAEGVLLLPKNLIARSIDPCPSGQAGLQDDKEIELLVLSIPIALLIRSRAPLGMTTRA
jgi:hypothetical protein